MVQFSEVDSDCEVTISAVSKDDPTKKVSHKFIINKSFIDLDNSYGSIDTSHLLEEGFVTTSPEGDVAIKFADVYDSKFYVEASILIDNHLESDLYPKFGIMVGSDIMLHSNEKAAFYFGDHYNNLGSWNSFGFVTKDIDSDIDWNNMYSFTIPEENSWTIGEIYTIGLLRDGINYYLFAKGDNGIKCYQRLVYEGFESDEACYAWIGGWSTAATISDFRCYTGDDADIMYYKGVSIDVGDGNLLLDTDEIYKINVTSDAVNFDLSKVEYYTDSEGIISINDGVITPLATGYANVYVKYGPIEKLISIEVTDDKKVNVVLDGNMDDLLWTDEVKENKLELYREDQTVLIDVYASRNSLGVYFFANYKSYHDYSSNTDWWTGNNFELRLCSVDGKLSNLNDGGTNQWYVSNVSGGVGNFDDYYISEANLDEITQMYEIKFELFISYASMNLSSTDLVGFSIGSNDGGDSWYSSDNFNLDDFYKMYKIYEGGIGQLYYPESVCNGEHEYGEWQTTVLPTCSEYGIKEAYCKLCNHRTTESVGMAEHIFGTDISGTITESTCSTQGEGYTLCLNGCGATSTIMLPIDPSNHKNWDETNGYCLDCNIACKEEVIIDRYSASGYDDESGKVYLAKDVSGDFVLTTTFIMEANVTKEPSGYWEGVIPVVQESLLPNSSRGSLWAMRFDWWGWCDQWSSTEKLTQQWDSIDADDVCQYWKDSTGNNAAIEKLDEVMANCTVEWKCSRTGTTVLNEFTITSISGEVFTYWSKATDISANKKLNIALFSEYVKYTVLDCDISK